MTFVDRIVGLLPFAAVALVLALSAVTSAHAILYKRDPRASVSWAGVIWLAPVVGAVLYVLFGINRIRRRAARLRRRRVAFDHGANPEICTPEELAQALVPDHLHLAPLQRVGDGVVGKPLLEGNQVAPLVNGEAAYPAMLAAIDAAQRSVSLLSYIFDKDPLGDSFIEALARASARGVQAKVLLDEVGCGRSLPSIERALAAGGVTSSRFLPIRLPFRTRHMNLRNHRKILVVDGRVGFTGGMNIRQAHLVERGGPDLVQDLHFRLEGPVVAHLQEAFADDWAFATGEVLTGGDWFPRTELRGSVIARGVPFDPGVEQDSLRWMIVGALACAKTSVRIVTPYFLPDPALIAALNVAALRGVTVDILLPRRSDNRIVDWASAAMLWQVLTGGCRVRQSAPPFEHTKLLLVDGMWTFLGSANLDPRSLRLNFEFNVECYDRELAAELAKRVDEKLAKAEPVALKQVDARPLPTRLRDGLARLLMPYL